MAKKIVEPVPEVKEEELPLVKSVGIVQLNNKYLCVILTSQGDKIVNVEELGFAGAKGFAVIEFKRWAETMFRSL